MTRPMMGVNHWFKWTSLNFRKTIGVPTAPITEPTIKVNPALQAIDPVNK